MCRRIGLRTRRALAQLTADDLAAKHCRRRASARFRLLAASHLGAAIRPVFIAYQTARQALGGERKNDKYGTEMLQHAFCKLKV